ncbi:uncharacterized protein LOC141828092 [Curcuma longa]|uniref:uncharacterized protein LOC141828092 n=1 Tax=Curcuma longa TaxID=136217 RepID=UPI003D9E6C54
MGTKVHSKSYLPGYQPTRDLNEDPNFSWPLFCEHKSVSRQLFDEFKPRAAGSWSEYDEDMLKRTMLEHEAIFRKQVYELHRLYRIQKELMHELKKTQMNRYFQTPNPSMFVSPLHSELDEKRWHASHRPMTTSNVIEVIDDNKASLYFLKEDMSPSKHGKCVKSNKPEETELKRFTRRILDLHLSADAYIEKEEDTEKIGRENVHGIQDDNGVQLTLGSVRIIHGIGKASLKSNWHSDGQSIHGLADLNEPIKDSWETEAVDSNIYKLDGLNVLSKEVAKPCLPTESETKFSHDYLNNGDSSNNLGTLTVGITQEQQQMLDNCAGQSRAVSNEYPSSFEQLKLKFKKSSSLLEQDTMGIWFPKKTVPVENSASLAVNLNNPRFKASQFTPTLMNLSSLNHVAASPPALISTDRMQIVGQNPVALQGLSCFKNSDAFKQSSIPECNKVQCNGDSQPQMEPDNLFLSRADDHRHAIQMNSTSLISRQHLQSNLGKPNLSDSNGFESQRPLKDSKFVDFQSVKGLNLNQALLCGEHVFSEQESLARKHNEASDSLVWLRKWSSCNGYADTKENDTRSNVHFNVEFQGLKIKNQDHAINHGKGKSIRNCRQGLENEINLNRELPVTENELCGASTVGIPSSLPMAADVGKWTCEIDLELPAEELEDDNMDIDINRPIATVDRFREKIPSLDVCITSAADAIVSMSKDAHTDLGRITNTPPAPYTCDSLHLLAEMATCMPEAFEASGDDGLDFFESMTLKLEELEADEYRCKSFKKEKTKDGEKPTCSMLSRPHRAPMRKRRQRKDFKNDVLPALTSLSRHEVTEDLRMLGGMTSTGKSRLTVSTKRNRNKNKSRSQRGRRQLRTLAIANTELENAGSSIIGWGRTTRRCARQGTANACAP